MKTLYLGLLWLYFLGFGYLAICVEPGFLDFDNLPDTNFTCVGKVIGGYYADLETNCQMFHVCTIGQLDEPMDIRFLCLNGTVFDQETRVCERIDEVDCSKSEQFYSLNLELYGNTQPSVPEDNAETDPPIIIKASTTTTTTTQKPTTKTTKAPPTTTKVITAHHFPITGGSDIRFNPEEINISLNPGASPSIRTKTIAYQQQVFNNNNDNKKIVVTTNYGTQKEEFPRLVPNTQRPLPSSTQKTKPPATPADINYGFTYHQPEEYTEVPHNYQYHHFRNGPFRNQFRTTTHLTTTRKQQPTTFRTPFYSSLKPNFQLYQTQNPQRLQLPLPLLPTLPPLTFSSPAPFTLGHHIETKRYTSDQPPRIIISASASVSDNSGRRLNYSLGTIGVTPLLEEPPKSYDEYKDHDVVLDPFYHDVPKIKNRKKRQVQIPDISGDQAAVDVLKFLFNWYKSQQSTTVKVPIDSEDITAINDKLAPVVETESLKNEDFKNSALFNRQSKFNIIGDVLSVTEKQSVTTQKPTPITTVKLDTVDYVDDNYEALTHEKIETNKEKSVTEKEELTTIEITTLPPTTTTTEPTTTSRIMGILKSRAKAHQKRIMNENKKKYSTSLNNLRPKIRRGRIRVNARKYDVLSSTTATEALTTFAPETTTFSKTNDKIVDTTLEESFEISTSLPMLEEDNLQMHSHETMSVITAPPLEDVSEENVSEEITTTHNIAIDNRESDDKDQQRQETQNGINLDKEKTEDEENEEYNELKKFKSHDDAHLLETTTHFQINNSFDETTIIPEEVTPAIEYEETTSTTKEEFATQAYTHEERNTQSGTELNTQENKEINTEKQQKEDSQVLDNYNNMNKFEDETSKPPKIKNEETLEKEDVDRENNYNSKEALTKPELDLPGTTTFYESNNIYNKITETTTNFEELSTFAVTEPTLATTDVTTEAEGTTVYYDTAAAEKTSTTTTSTTTALPLTTEVEDATNLTPADTTTTETSITRRGRRRRPRPQSYRKPNSRHRFSTEITSKPTKSKIEAEIINGLTTSNSNLEEPKILTSTDLPEEIPATDAPLFKSANPTQAETAKESLHTTPMYKLDIRRRFIFNCFGKPINKFYSDPRDCRLFHYCTSGYTKNQLLDMKFVCDLGTYFDDEKLICTKVKPERCL